MNKRARLSIVQALVLSVSIFVVSCGGGPGIETLSRPVTRTAGANLTFDGRTYSPLCRQVLKEYGLERLAKRDPAEAVRKLDQYLEKSGQPELRLAAAEVAMNEAIKHDGKGSSEEFGYLLCAVRLSEGGLGLKDSTLHSDLVGIYNVASAELAWLLHQHAGSGQKVEALGPLGRRSVGWARSSRETRGPSFYDTLTPTSRIKVKGFDAVNIRPGVGGSLVGYRKATDERLAKDPFMPYTGYGISLTAVVEWSGAGEDARIVLHDLIKKETVEIRGRSYPLAADFTAAIATVTNVAPSPMTGWLGMLRPAKEKEFVGLFTVAPYRDDLIPLILVHGLLSTPETWREVINLCASDPVLRKNYQMLTFFYPTGYPILQNAATLRAQMKGFQEFYDPGRENRRMRNMVMVGHSMGCNLTNSQIRNGGDALWSAFFNKSLEEISDDPAVSEQLRERAYFKANPNITRAVFICGPHRGSPLSNAWLGRFGANLIRFPLHSIDALSGNFLTSSTALGRSVLDEPISSINQLKVNSPILELILKQPMPHDPALHSIIGDRGKAPGKGSSDGVVPYWSSHLDGVKSEKFIPASHTKATNNPENVREIQRILRLHVGKGMPSAALEFRSKK
jgi:pimeloyl-ACP methyl ester carboxylesterase